MQQIAAIKAQQGATTAASQNINSAWCYTFNTNLGFAQSGTNDVANLHTALQEQGISYSPDDINIYSTGTSQAIIQFQKKYSISPQSGYVGNSTKAKFNALVR